MKTTCLVAVLALGAGTRPAIASAQEFHVDTSAESNRVTFVSRASIEEFEGVTDRVDGYVLLDAKRLGDAVGGDDTEFYFEVDLASLDTGIGLRNRHMRDNYLEVGTYPFATFAGRIDHVEPRPDGWRVLTSGTFTVHGVGRTLAVPCDVQERGNGYRTRCAFRVRLSEHDIEIPRVMFMKLADEIELRLDFSLVPAVAGDR